jgi:hypothetical protein
MPPCPGTESSCRTAAILIYSPVFYKRTLPNGTTNDELVRTWKEAAVAYSDVIFQYFHGEREREREQQYDAADLQVYVSYVGLPDCEAGVLTTTLQRKVS